MPEHLGRPLWKPSSFLAVGALLCLALPLAVQAQDCDQALERADSLYVRAEFDEAIALLTGCMEGGSPSEDDRARAYRLIGLSYIGKGQMAEARAAAEELMAVKPDYEPDPADDPPTWQRLVEEVEPEEAASPNAAPPDDPPPAGGGPRRPAPGDVRADPGALPS